MKASFERLVVLFIVVGVAFIVLDLGNTFVRSSVVASTPIPYLRFFPFIDRQPASWVGADMAAYSPDYVDLLAGAGAKWVRGYTLHWDELEATQGTINWSALVNVDSQLQVFREHRLSTIVLITGTPTWAQHYTGADYPPCGPVELDHLVDLVDFFKQIVDHYSRSPYWVSYFEYINEPDPLVSDRPSFVSGCWGDHPDLYATAITSITQAVHAAYPSVQIVMGGLMADCDATLTCSGTPSMNFLPQVLAHGAQFDAVNIHSYDWYSPTIDGYWNKNWKTVNVPALEAKLDWLEGLLSEYRISPQIFNSEVALQCLNPSGCGPAFEIKKGEYLSTVFQIGFEHHLTGQLWYGMKNDWKFSDLFQNGTTPNPAWYTLVDFLVEH